VGEGELPPEGTLSSFSAGERTDDAVYHAFVQTRARARAGEETAEKRVVGRRSRGCTRG
jgi:hypothetical protein